MNKKKNKNIETSGRWAISPVIIPQHTRNKQQRVKEKKTKYIISFPFDKTHSLGNEKLVFKKERKTSQNWAVVRNEMCAGTLS